MCLCGGEISAFSFSDDVLNFDLKIILFSLVIFDRTRYKWSWLHDFLSSSSLYRSHSPIWSWICAWHKVNCSPTVDTWWWCPWGAMRVRVSGGLGPRSLGRLKSGRNCSCGGRFWSWWTETAALQSLRMLSFKARLTYGSVLVYHRSGGIFTKNVCVFYVFM